MKKAIKSISNENLHMNRWKAIVFAVLATFVVGCGNEYDVIRAKALDGKDVYLQNLSIVLSFSTCDNLFWDKIWQHDHDTDKVVSSDSLLATYYNWRSMETNEKLEHPWLASEFFDSAYTKRKTALLMGRCVFSYKFDNYIRFDGVSAMIYNVAYIFSVPRKALTALRCSDGIIGYISDLIILAIGFFLAIIGFFVSSILGLVCHPLETLSNLLVGVAYFGDGGFEAWKAYVLHTNFFASLWDLVWGAIIYPLWQLVMFWA